MPGSTVEEFETAEMVTKELAKDPTEEVISLSFSSKSVTSKETPTEEKFLKVESSPFADNLIPILLCLATSFGGFIFGWDVGTIGGVTNMVTFQNYFGTQYDSVNNVFYFPMILVGAIVSIFNVSCALGGLFLAGLADIQGRKFGIYAALAIYSSGTLVSWTCGNQWWYFFCARFIAGLGVGATAVMVPMFIAESAPLKIRGSMVVLYQLMITLGILTGNVINYVCKTTIPLSNNATWKVPLGLGNLWAVIIALGTHFMPESPVFLINKRRNVLEARKSFATMNNLPPDDQKVIENINELFNTAETKALESQTNGKNNRFEFLFGEPKLGLRLFIGIMVMAFQQLSGANYFFYYGTSLFGSVGIEDSYITSILLSSVNFISTFGGVYLVEKLGRKSCLIIGSVGMFTCMTIYASVGSFLLSDQAESVGIIMIVFTCIYIMFFACTSGPVTFVVISELFPAKTKALSMAICTSINWICNFLISLLTPFITEKIGFKFGFVFSAFLFFSIWFFIFMLRETKNKTPEEIDSMYAEIK